MNLIPEELELAQQRRRRLRTWAVAVAVCLVVGAVVAAWKYRSFSSVDRAANAVTQEIAALDKQQQQVASAENLLQRWQGRLALQRRLTRYPAVADIAACLTRNSPEMLFLHQLQCAPPTTESTDRQPAPPLPQAAQMFKLKVPPVRLRRSSCARHHHRQTDRRAFPPHPPRPCRQLPHRRRLPGSPQKPTPLPYRNPKTHRPRPSLDRHCRFRNPVPTQPSPSPHRSGPC